MRTRQRGAAIQGADGADERAALAAHLRRSCARPPSPWGGAAAAILSVRRACRAQVGVAAVDAGRVDRVASLRSSTMPIKSVSRWLSTPSARLESERSIVCETAPRADSSATECASVLGLPDRNLPGVQGPRSAGTGDPAASFLRVHVCRSWANVIRPLRHGTPLEMRLRRHNDGRRRWKRSGHLAQQHRLSPAMQRQRHEDATSHGCKGRRGSRHAAGGRQPARVGTLPASTSPTAWLSSLLSIAPLFTARSATGWRSGSPSSRCTDSHPSAARPMPTWNSLAFASSEPALRSSTCWRRSGLWTPWLAGRSPSGHTGRSATVRTRQRRGASTCT